MTERVASADDFIRTRLLDAIRVSLDQVDVAAPALSGLQITIKLKVSDKSVRAVVVEPELRFEKIADNIRQN